MTYDLPGRLPDRRHACAVVVTYHPDNGFPARLSRIVPQLDATVIVDNGSSDAELRMLRELSTYPSVTLICNFENLGIA